MDFSKCNRNLAGADHCSYCGSMSVERAIQLLTTPGTKFSGSDWKYGYPHKFYISNNKEFPQDLKFYSGHLVYAENNLLEKFNELAKKCFDIVFSKQEYQLGYYCRPGVQLFGTVKENGLIEHGTY